MKYLSFFYSFGPLTWRSSKEREKTKHYRRDKCNSGDSGIQVEIENDETVSNGSDNIDSVTGRRLTSKKISNISTVVKNKLSLKKENNQPQTRNMENKLKDITPLQRRSLSHPSGLETFHVTGDDNKQVGFCEGESDTDSEVVQTLKSSINITKHQQQQQQCDVDTLPVYAEVLYAFEPVGHQELRLDKGALIEVIKRETGPWWFGQIKHDAVLVNTQEFHKRDGWFPKEFVRVSDSLCFVTFVCFMVV